MATLPHLNRPLMSLFENDDVEESLDKPEGGFVSKANFSNCPPNVHLNQLNQIEKIKGKILIDPTALLPQTTQGTNHAQIIHHKGTDQKHLLLHSNGVREKLATGTNATHKINAELLSRSNSSDKAALSSATPLTFSPKKPHISIKGARPANYNMTNAETNFAKTHLEGDKIPVIVEDDQNTAAILNALPTLTRPRLPAKRRPPTNSSSNNCLNLVKIDDITPSHNDSLHIDHISLLPSDYLFSNLLDTSTLTNLTISYPAETLLDDKKANEKHPKNGKLDTDNMKISQNNEIDLDSWPNIKKTTFPIPSKKFNITSDNTNNINNNNTNYNHTKLDNIASIPPSFSKNIKNFQNKEVLFQPTPGNLKPSETIQRKLKPVQDHLKLNNNQSSLPITHSNLPSPKIKFNKPDHVIANNICSNSNNNHSNNRHEDDFTHSTSDSNKVSSPMRKKQPLTKSNGQDSPLIAKHRNTISTFDDHRVANLMFSTPSKLIATRECDGKLQDSIVRNSFSTTQTKDEFSSTETSEDLKVRTLNFRQLKQAFEGNCINVDGDDGITSPPKALPRTPKNILQSKNIQNHIQTPVNLTNRSIEMKNLANLSPIQSNPYKKSVSINRGTNSHESQLNARINDSKSDVTDNANHIPTSPNSTSILNNGSIHKGACGVLAAIDFWEPPRDYTPTIDYDEDDKSIHEDGTSPSVPQICQNDDGHITSSALKDDKRIKMMTNTESTEDHSPNQATLIRTRNQNNKFLVGRPKSVACPGNTNIYTNINNNSDKNNTTIINNVVLQNYNSLPKKNILSNSPVHKRSSDLTLTLDKNKQATNISITKQEISFIDD